MAGEVYRLKVPVIDLPPQELKVMRVTSEITVDLFEKYKGICYYFQIHEHNGVDVNYEINDNPQITVKANSKETFDDVCLEKIHVINPVDIDLVFKIVPIDLALRKGWIEKG